MTAQAQQEQNVALPFRSYTLLGVCEALGQDFGINPLFLRVPLGAMVVFSWKIALAAYLALGVLVLVSRLLFPAAKVVNQPMIESQPEPANSQVETKLAA